MDTNRFDALARTVGTGTTRRSALALLTGLGLGARDRAETEARKSGKCQPKCAECEKCKKGDCDKKQGKKVCKKGKCKPKPNGTACTGGACCGGVCRSLQSDEANCGTCGTVCTANQSCQAGSCFPRGTCPGTQTALCPSTACGTGPGGAACLCSLSTEGNVVCVILPPSASCATLTPCSSSATCTAGEACVETGSCCAAAGGLPTHACAARCPTPTAA